MAPTASIVIEPNPAQLRSNSGTNWLSVVTHLDPRYGGMSNVVPQLASQMVNTRVASVSLAAFCAPDEVYSAADDRSSIVSTWPTSRLAWFKDKSLPQRFSAVVGQMDGVHIHGLWEQSTLIAARTAKAAGVPYILSAHGMLDRWAVKNKRIKKAVYSGLFERSNVEGAKCLHALTAAEVEDYRRYGVTGPIAVVPNGVDIPSTMSSDLFLTTYPSLKGKRLILFLGRIHFKKGLDILLESWKQVARLHPDAHLVLAGPDSENTVGSVEAMIQNFGITQSVSLTGMLEGKLKWSAFAASECFVLPSYSEGLSVSTLEAMGTGLPVILSDRCNLPEVADIGAGWVIAAKAHLLRQALEEALENKSNVNRAIGQRGRKHILDRYSWPHIAKQMGQVYQWVAGGDRPESVEILHLRGFR